MYKWARYSKNAYEVSSKGDKRFSAFFARLKDGRSIEEAYQLDIKGYRQFSNDPMFGKENLHLLNYLLMNLGKLIRICGLFI